LWNYHVRCYYLTGQCNLVVKKNSEICGSFNLDLDAQIDKLKSVNIDFFSIVDSPLSRPLMSPIALYHKIEENKKTAIMYFTCRDSNLVAIEGDILSTYALGIKNILALTGYLAKNTKGVFEFSSCGLM